MSATVLSINNQKPGGSHRLDSSPGTSSGYLTYIDGLRGLAIALVVVFHIFVGKVSSGVDVFLFVGGIMLLSSQMKNSMNKNGMTVFQSILRILRRLLPALVTVVAVTMVASMFIYGPATWNSIFMDAVSSVTYWVNWRFALEGNSYATAGADTSMFQHLWSMSVQMQIYLIVIALVFFIRFLVNRSFNDKGEIVQRSVTIAIISVLSIASFIYATVEGVNNQTVNYYSPFSRFWEIGAGALLGIILFKTALRPVLRWVFSILGLAMIFSVGLFLDGSEQFPGPWALIPIIGAALVLMSGISYGNMESRNWHNFGPIMLLETKPFQILGRISYSLYLWHWALLILVVKATGMESNDLAVGIPVVIASLILAWLTQKYIEAPLRQKNKPERGIPFTKSYYRSVMRFDPPRRMVASAISVVSVLSLIIVSPGLLMAGQGINHAINQRKIEAAGGWDQSYPGAAEILNNASYPDDVPIEPDLNDARGMMPETQGDHCYTNFGSTDLVLTDDDGNPCEYGDTSSDKTMYLVGGSHSEQYLPALEEVAKNRGFKIIPILKMGCALYQDFRWDGQLFTECYEDWSPKAEKYILDNPPTEGVFMTSTRPTTVDGDGPEIVPQYYVDVFNRIADAGIKIYGVRDNPWFTTDNYGERKDVRTCVSEHQGNPHQCGQEASKTLLPTNPSEISYGIDSMSHIDLTPAMVRDGWALPVIGNLLTYRDSHHMTNAFVKTLAPELERQMFP